MRALVPALFVFLAVVTSTPASAQHLSLHIRGGRVTLDARDVTLQQILEEWTRIGGVRVVNGQQMSATPLTLLLRDMSEREALDILLRGQAGYMLVARTQAGEERSAFGSIHILPSSTPPAAGPAARIGAFANDRQQPLASPIETATEFAVAATVHDDVADRNVAEPAAPTTEPAPNNGFAAAGAGAMGSSTASDRPPSPMLPPPPPRPTAGNPFGVAPGATAPSAGTPAGPPPGVFYPPVTNPDLIKNGSSQPGR